MRKIIGLVMLLILATGSHAQQLRPANSTRIYHEISQLRNLVNVLYVAAHPDDENTRLLAWMVNDMHIRTAYLSLTRGDGGQNILGSEQGDALGLIRTHELMEARIIDGAEQYFSRAVDFGFSKNYQETFKHWDKDTLTGDAVWVMRKFRPDVVICRFPPDSNAGHGHHAASAIIGAAAFKASGDAGRFTGQLQNYPAWQPKRILFNAYRFGTFNTTKEDMFKLQVGQYEPLLGVGTGELAGISRSIHRSQGAGTASVPGVQNEYFRLVDGAPFSNSIFDGIDITWNRVGRPEIGDKIDLALKNFDFLHPEKSISELLAIRKLIESVTDDYWRNQKLEEINKAILDCSGFMAELFCKQPVAVAGSKLPFVLHIIARADKQIILKSIQWNKESDTIVNMQIGTDSLFTIEHSISIPADALVTQPYWLSTPSAGALFTISNRSLLGLPETPDSLTATLTLEIGGQDFNVPVPLSYKKLDPLKGDVVEQLRVVPAATIAFSTGMLITNRDSSVQADVQIHAHKNIKDAELIISSGSSLITFVKDINLLAGTDTTLSLHISPKMVSQQGGGDYYLAAKLQTEDETFDRSQHIIQYSHIPTLQYFTAPSVKVIYPNWKSSIKRIGYVEGAGDNIPSILSLAGLEVDILKENDMANVSKLKKYDAIISGIRAINVEKKMVTWMPVLLQYAANGGTLIMLYNTLQDPVTSKIGPYPITLSNKRVTEEDATVTLIDPKDQLLNYPNKITDDDFKNWVQERGLYFPSKWDERYKALFSMHDDGEQPLTGSTLFAKVGKGNYIYTSLSFSRQLPAGNTGSIRLLMNMLSVGK